MPEKKPANGTPEITSIKELAEHLGLSWWTVSRALNGHLDVKQATRERIFKAVRESGFAPNPLARGLVGGRTRIVGVSFHELDPGLVKTIAALQQQLRESNYKALIELGCDDLQLETEAISHFAAMRADGVVMFNSRQPKDAACFKLLERRGIPYVMVDPENAIMPRVMIDRKRAMKDILGHLYDLGHREFTVAGIDPDLWYNATRWAGLREAMRERNLSVKNLRYLRGPATRRHDFTDGEHLAEEYLAAQERPTAVITISDRVAIGFIRRLRKANLRVPDYCSVVGAQNLDIGAHSTPSLTTFDFRTDKLTRTATELLLKQVETRKGSPRTRYVSGDVVPRESTAAPQR